MNGIEDRLRDAFGARAEAVRPHPGARAENARRIRRSRTRRGLAVPAVALATAAAVALPVSLPHGRDRDGREAAGAGSPGGLVDPSTIVTIPASLPGGAAFVPDALGADGTVIGRGAANRVYTAGPKGGSPEDLGVRAQGGLSAGKGFVTWIEPGSWYLSCDGAKEHAGGQGPEEAAPSRPVLASGGMVAGSDPMDQPFVATGCNNAAHTLDNHGKGVLGLAMAFAYPTLFVADTSNDHVIREIDVRSEAIVREHPLPDGVLPLKLTGKADQGGVRRSVPGTGSDQRWLAAANTDYFASLAGGRLRIVARDGWRPAAKIDLSGPGGENKGTSTGKGAVRLSAGDHVIAYTADGTSGVIDTRTLADRRARAGATRILVVQGPVLAAGGWLLWRDGSGYRLGRVR